MRAVGHGGGIGGGSVESIGHWVCGDEMGTGSSKIDLSRRSFLELGSGIARCIDDVAALCDLGLSRAENHDGETEASMNCGSIFLIKFKFFLS